MKTPPPPRFDQRRTAEFKTELLARARAWVPEWGLTDGERDFGRALLEIAARFSSDVAERLDLAGEKMRRGFLDWLAVRGKAARPSRVPVVFKLADSAKQDADALPPVRLQADAGGTTVVFETEKDLRIVRGTLDVVVGVDAEADAFYLPAPGLSDLQPIDPVPTQWTLKSFASTGGTKLQLDPEAGLEPELLIRVAQQQYRIVKAEKGIVTIDPPLDTDLDSGVRVDKVTTFAPFDGAARNRQAHALYLGHMDLLNIEAAAAIDVVGASVLGEGFTWQYWGKVDGQDGDEDAWRPLTISPVDRPGAIVLNKPKGAVDPRRIGDTNSRWIRAYATNVGGAAPALRVDTLELRINYQPTPPACPAPAVATESSPAAEALANTTPIVLDSAFFPLGKEPKQFDAFYLGSQEAFSKKAAKVQLCFEMADPTFFALSAVRDGQFAGRVLAGVAKDGALHLLAIDPASGAVSKLLDRDPLQPPAPGYNGQPTSGPAVPLDAPFPPIGIDPAPHQWRLPVWTEVDFFGLSGFLVGVSAGDAIWAWREHSIDRHLSGWISFGSVPAVTPAPTAHEPVAGLVHLAAPMPANALLVALRKNQMSKRLRADGSGWQAVATKVGAAQVNLESIIPVLDAAKGFATSITGGLVGVSDAGNLYSVDVAGICTLLPGNADVSVRPIAVTIGTDLVVAFVKSGSQRDIVMYHETHGLASIHLQETDAQVLGFEVASNVAGVIFLASVLAGGAGYVASWEPQSTPVAKLSYSRSAVSAGVGTLKGIPTEIADRLVIPGSRGDALIAPFDPTKRFTEQAVLLAGAVLPASAPSLVPTDVVTLIDTTSVPNVPVEQEIQAYGNTRDGEVLYRIAGQFSAGTSGPLLAYRVSAPLTGKVTSGGSQLELQAGDHEAIVNSFLRVGNSYFKITALTTTADPWVADVTPTTLTGTTVTYAKPIPTGGRTAPFIELSPPASGNWPASLLASTQLLFPRATPELQSAKAFDIDGAGHPLLVALGQEFATPPPVSPASLVVDASLGDWTHILEDASANPELSWEYSNGKGWWKLPVTLDDTQNLKTTGALQFKIPDDIAASDWAGQTNFWIRARLIGGDYGQPKVTVHTKDLGGGETEQTVDRSSEGIRPPSVLRLDISYSVADGVMPTFVLAEDSGSVRDQSEANRTAGAIVEAFVPIGVELGRLSAGSALSEATPPCPPDCACDGASPASNRGAPAVPLPVTDAPALTGKALFVGFDAVPEGAPVNVLLLVDVERNHDAFAPLRVDAFIADRFVPIVTSDETRGIGESGLLKMAFTVAPTRRELFGREVTWLRLTPATAASTDGADWKPSIRGAYLNAAWASAAETMTRELLGSSDGAPNLTVTLARPPVLDDTLELRVKEPLGEEERAQLREGDPTVVLTDVDGLDGDWVRWKPVVDPSDEPSDARVYAIDEADGTVTFGDGVYGMIPPIGTDSIVAFSYRRTEPPKPGSEATAPANLVGPRTPLNLVSPIDGVESVIAADQAAGGSPPESDDRVLRFGFARQRHRGRALTSADLEDLALESSPDIVQARCLQRTNTVRLVIVMRGADPMPSASQIRELHRLLVDAAPTSLSAPRALAVVGPVVRRLRVRLKLHVPTLDVTGEVSTEVKHRLAALFDTGSGGTDHEGWPLGANPTADDIGIALIDTPQLESIEEVEILEATDDGDRPWPGGLKSNELALLDQDPVRIEFETAEVLV
ncbi:MAG: baseplate J/gp47 family protein [Acidobacteriota bacterium]|nr:baseplate J/gp47 family protein [Acidobacteriota bacterium]